MKEKLCKTERTQSATSSNVASAAIPPFKASQNPDAQFVDTQFALDLSSGPNAPKAKECSSCQSQKKLSDFYQKENRWDSQCKECIKAAKRSKRLIKRKRTKGRRVLARFEKVFFEGEPNKRLLAERLKPLIEEVMSDE